VTADELFRWLTRANPTCVCGKVIPDTAVYYGFTSSEDQDEPGVFINEWHEHCLGEWGWVRDTSEMGIAHGHYDGGTTLPLPDAA